MINNEQLRKMCMDIEEPLRNKFGANIRSVITDTNEYKGYIKFVFYQIIDQGTGKPIDNGIPLVGKPEEIVVRLQVPVYDEAKYIKVESYEEWKNILDSHKEKDYLIDGYDNWDQLEIGFIVRRNSGSYCYVIDYKDAYNSRSDIFKSLDFAK